MLELSLQGIGPAKPRPTRLFGKNYHWVEVDDVLVLGRCDDPFGTGRCLVCGDKMAGAA